MHVFEQQSRDLGEVLSEARHYRVKMFERYRGLSQIFVCLSRVLDETQQCYPAAEVIKSASCSVETSYEALRL